MGRKAKAKKERKLKATRVEGGRFCDELLSEMMAQTLVDGGEVNLICPDGNVLTFK